ncbi:9789_t:CDS:1, partial [Gigaspora margarita]
KIANVQVTINTRLEIQKCTHLFRIKRRSPITENMSYHSEHIELNYSEKDNNYL